MTQKAPASSTEVLVQSPLLIKLRDELNLATNAPEKWLTVRKWKNDLIQKDYKDILHAVKELSTTESPYIKNTLLSLIEDSLQTTTITSLLDIIHTEYSSNLWKDSFPEKKQAIKLKLQNMYARGILDNKLIFWLGVFLIKNKDPKYAGSFLSDIQKWLYTWDTVNESFWNIVIPSNNPQKDTVQTETTQSIQETITASQQE